MVREGRSRNTERKSVRKRRKNKRKVGEEGETQGKRQRTK